MKAKQRIVVGLSGGVDSSVAAWLLKREGHEVVGVFMKNWEDDDTDLHCTSRQDLIDAALERRTPVAARLVEPVLEQAGMTGVRVLMALGTALVGTALARAELDRGTPPARLEAALLGQLRAARPYGLGSWEQTASRWARWGAGWDPGALRKALRLALDADRALKSTTLTHEPGILVQLVLSFGALQQEAA